MMQAALMLVLLCAPARTGEVTVDLKTVEGELVCSVRTRGANPADVLAEIARKTDRELAGVESLVPSTPIPIDLEERPLNYVVQTIAACAGWRAHVNISRIVVESDLDSGDEKRAFEDQYFSAYLRAIRAHPDDLRAAEGEMWLGDLREQRGDLRAAESHFVAVSTKFRQRKEAPDALLRAGLIEERLGEWDKANETFRSLANLEQAHPHQARARLEIARCMSELGNGREALFVLDSLEKIFPTALTSERQSRLYVRARALLADKREADAIQALASADALGQNKEWDADAMELRAEALAHFGRHAESGRAWLAYSQKVSGQDRLRAFVNAAQQSREAGDALGVLFILHHDDVRGTRAESAIQAIAEEARKEIGLSGDAQDSLGGDSLAQARSLLDLKKPAKALALLEPLYQRREERAASERLELVTLYARALAGEQGADAAAAELRRNLDAFTDPAARKLLCTTAGEIYEDAERFEEAIRAFGGQL